MRTIPLGYTGPAVSVLSYGCMRISGAWDPARVTAEKRQAGREAVLAAWDSGYTLFDHADIYASGVSEEIFGEVMKDTPSLRAGAVIATKCGIRWAGDTGPNAPHRYDFSKEHILASCDLSLKRLGVERIELYQLHRPDLLMDPSDIGEAFSELEKAGKVRTFGVSNFSASQVRMLQSCLAQRLVVNQIEFHLARLDPMTDGVVDQCIADRLTPLAWSPLAGGWLGGGDVPAGREELGRVADEIAEGHGVSRGVIALAWLLRHPSGVIPIVGSVRPEKIREMARAAEITLSREDWYRLTLASRGTPLP